MIGDVEGISALNIEFDGICQTFADVIVPVERQHFWLQRRQPAFIEIDGVADNDLISGLLGAGRSAIQNAAWRTALAKIT